MVAIYCEDELLALVPIVTQRYDRHRLWQFLSILNYEASWYLYSSKILFLKPYLLLERSSTPKTEEYGFCFYGEGPRSRCYERTAALRFIVQSCDEDDQFPSFFCVTEHRWNEIDRGKPKYTGKNLSQCQFVHHKSHMNWPGIETGLPRWEAGD
jgi:hypothetical protein